MYEEYKKYCEKLRRDLKVVQITDPNAVVVNGMLQIKKTEIVTGRRTQIQPLPNTFDAKQPYGPVPQSNLANPSSSQAATNVPSKA